MMMACLHIFVIDAIFSRAMPCFLLLLSRYMRHAAAADALRAADYFMPMLAAACRYVMLFFIFLLPSPAAYAMLLDRLR